MFKLGLTGSIGMGKSTTAALFEAEGCAVWDADAAVHRLYGPGGEAVGAIEKLYPEVIQSGTVSRAALRAAITRDPRVLKAIESVVHPLVAKDREAFEKMSQSDICVFDIPLLFETGGNTTMDAVACVTVSPEIQRQRVMERGKMTAEQFEQIRDKQMPNAKKCALSDFVIETDTLDHAREQVRDIVRQIREQQNA